MASLPSISSQEFDNKVANAQRTHEAADVVESYDRSCASCHGTFDDLKSYQSHLQSWTHFQTVDQRSLSGEDVRLNEAPASGPLESVLMTESQSDSEEESEASTERFVPSRCLFCTHDCHTTDDSLEHMQKNHGLFIADREYLIDMETFVGYLFTIISEFNECLYCGHVKRTVEGIRRHMLDKGHCKLKTHRDTEYEEFYDFSDSDQHGDGETNYKRSEDANAPSSSQLEMRLKSGNSIGHRSQARSFRQNHRHYDKPTEFLAITATGEDANTDQAKSQTPGGRQLVKRSRGELGMVGVSELQKRSLRAVEKKILRVEIRTRNQYRAAVEKATNRQKHFKVSGIQEQ